MDYQKIRQNELVKDCQQCGKKIDIFVRIDDHMFCSVRCAEEYGELVGDKNTVIFSHGVSAR